ncbi:MAG: ribonuclease HI [Proteobacteria bacterium]|nr:MAG: ribonuclease HI [Pseudomonadota bacterium]
MEKEMTKNNNPLPAVTIYTDGACSPNPGPGGWGAVLLHENQDPIEINGFGGETTNNRMELTSVISALNTLDRPHRITLYTDSQYVKNGITSWINNWLQKNWLTTNRQPVKNVDLWKKLLEEIERHDIDWRWIKGHAANTWNERADELAVAARQQHRLTEKENRDIIRLYTGVTCKHSTGIGAWSVILCWRNHVRVFGRRTDGMTANQLYIEAVITGLSTLTRQVPVAVYTHSGYLKDGATSWLPGWQKRNWLTREGTPVSNRELWQQLARLMKRYEITFHLGDREDPLCFMLEAKELAREYEQDDIIS